MSEETVEQNAIPDGPKLKSQRITLGYSQEELSHMTNVAVKTISNVENGKPARIETLKILAEKLNMNYAETLRNAERPRKARIRITTTYEFDNFDDRERQLFIEMLSSHLPTSGKVGEVSFEKGSTILEVEMLADDATELIAAFLAYQVEMPEIKTLRKAFAAQGGGSGGLGMIYRSIPKWQKTPSAHKYDQMFWHIKSIEVRTYQIDYKNPISMLELLNRGSDA